MGNWSLQSEEEEGTITVSVPMRFIRRGGRKLIIGPEHRLKTSSAAAEKHPAVVKAIARAFYWQHLLRIGTYQTIKELADARQIDLAYCSRVLKLTLLAPDLVEMILNYQGTCDCDLRQLLGELPEDWAEQRRQLSS